MTYSRIVFISAFRLEVATTTRFTARFRLLRSSPGLAGFVCEADLGRAECIFIP